MFWFQVLPVWGYPPWYGSHHGRQGPHTVLCWQQLHEQTSQSTLHGRSGDHARDIIQHTPGIIHHISHNSGYTTCCVDSAPGVYLCLLHPSVQNAPFHRGKGEMMMCVCVDIPLVCTCVFYTTSWYVPCVIYGYQSYAGAPPHCAKLVHIYCIFIFCLKICLYYRIVFHISSMSQWRPLRPHLDPAAGPGDEVGDPGASSPTQRAASSLRPQDLEINSYCTYIYVL